MKKNFKIEGTVNLLIDELTIDINNSYTFCNFEYSISDNTLIFLFSKSEGAWIKESDPNLIRIIFYDLVNFEVINENKGIARYCFGIVEEMGYWPTNTEMKDWIMNESDFDEELDIVFRFEKEKTIRVKSKEAKLIYL